MVNFLCRDAVIFLFGISVMIIPAAVTSCKKDSAAILSEHERKAGAAGINVELRRLEKELGAAGHNSEKSLILKKIATIHLRKGDVNSAGEAARSGLALDVKDAALHYLLGKALLDGGRCADAVYELEKALALDPRMSRASFELGNCLYLQGDIKSAADHYRRCIEADEEHGEACNNLGVALARQGKFREAEAMFRKALAAREPYVRARKNLAILYEKNLKDRARALEEYRAFRETLTDEFERRVIAAWIATLGGR